MKLVFALALALIGSISAAPAAQRPLNGIVAIVNDSIITWKDVYNRMEREIDFLERQYLGRPEAFEKALIQMEQGIVEDLVAEKLILNEYKTAGYNLPDSFLEDRVNKTIREYGSRAILAKTLQAQGLTYENFRERVRERTIIEEMRRHHVPRDPVISPQRIEMYYAENQEQFRVPDQIKLRMIVIPKTAADPDFSPKHLAAEIAAKLEEGASFAEMARVYSASQSAEGGDRGWIDKSVLRADLAEKAFALQAGQRSGVIEAEDGCYLMLVEETRSTHVKAIADVREEIETTLKEQERRRLQKNWIDRLKSKSFVRFFPY